MKLYARAVVFCLFLLILPIFVFAQNQTEPVLSYTVEFFGPGVSTVTGTPATAPTVFQLSWVTCNLVAQTTTAPVVNPTGMRFADPANAGRDCDISGASWTSAILALPAGTGYVATIKANGATLSSVRSAASNPFSKQIVWLAPLVPSGVKVRP